MIQELPKNKKLILFDGVCNLCNTSVQYVIKHDKKNVFMFAALQSDVGKQIINHFKLNTTKVDSILLYTNSKNLKIKSSAALHIVKHLGFPQNLAIIFLLIPTVIRNWVYDFVAKNRYKWYGKKESCWLPTPNLRSKFIGKI